jgi:hypothetical protein
VGVLVHPGRPRVGRRRLLPQQDDHGVVHLGEIVRNRQLAAPEVEWLAGCQLDPPLHDFLAMRRQKACHPAEVATARLAVAKSTQVVDYFHLGTVSPGRAGGMNVPSYALRSAAAGPSLRALA